jgi:hypothetical protein
MTIGDRDLRQGAAGSRRPTARSAFERVASQTKDGGFRQDLEKQAAAYRKLTAEPAEKLGLAPPASKRKRTEDKAGAHPASFGVKDVRLWLRPRESSESSSLDRRAVDWNLTCLGALVCSEERTMSDKIPTTDADSGKQVQPRPCDAGSQANETVDGLDSSTEALRRAAEDTPSGASRDDVEATPVFDRADLAPKI